MLGALTPLCLLGARYAVAMLPMLFFEFAWKSIWLLSFALPLWLGVVVCLIAIPWVYTFKEYVLKSGRSLEIASQHVHLAYGFAAFPNFASHLRAGARAASVIVSHLTNENLIR